MSVKRFVSSSSLTPPAAGDSQQSSPPSPEAMVHIVSQIKNSPKRPSIFFALPCQDLVAGTTLFGNLRNGCCEAVQSCVPEVLPLLSGSRRSKLEHFSPPRKTEKIKLRKVDCNHSLSQQGNTHCYDDSLPASSPKNRLRAVSPLRKQTPAQADLFKVDHFAVPRLPQSPKAVKPFVVLNKPSQTSPSAAAFSNSHPMHTSAEKASECSDADKTSRILFPAKLRLKRKWNETSTSPVAIPMPSIPRQKQRRTNSPSNCSMPNSGDRDHEANMLPLPSTALSPISKPLKLATETTCEMKNLFKMKYEATRKIGAGGGGVVYSGKRIRDNVNVAIKRVFKEKVRRWGQLDGKTVPLEFELLHKATRSGNPGVVAMLDWYERKSSYILVMERPQHAIDLFDYLKLLGPMTEFFARKIFLQVADGVRLCHKNGVIHRDIKDENVILNMITGEAKIIDFGCGMHSQVAPATAFAGTFQFYPPEWYIHHSYDCKQLDLWGLGALLYTMVEGEVPFQTIQDIVYSKLNFKRLSKNSLCRNLIELMLEKDPKDRLTMTEIFGHSWVKKNNRSASCLFPKFTSSRPETSVSLATSVESKSPKALLTSSASRKRSSLNVTASPEALTCNKISSEISSSLTVTSTKLSNKKYFL